jgi:prolyl-tRNA synthetase
VRIVAGIEAAILYLCIIKNMLDIMLYKKKGNIMAKEKKLVEAITPMDKDFTQWYTDVVTKAELISYSNVRGCMIIRPRGYAIWENIQKQLDARFKETGVENVYLPMLIPESLLQKEKDHVEGFAPEVAWVTHGGEEKLAERLCVRPTSETLFCDHVKDIVHSYRDLPVVYNQWCSVLRWEKIKDCCFNSRNNPHCQSVFYCKITPLICQEYDYIKRENIHKYVYKNSTTNK